MKKKECAKVEKDGKLVKFNAEKERDRDREGEGEREQDRKKD